MKADCCQGLELEQSRLRQVRNMGNNSGTDVDNMHTKQHGNTRATNSSFQGAAQRLLLDLSVR